MHRCRFLAYRKMSSMHEATQSICHVSRCLLTRGVKFLVVWTMTVLVHRLQIVAASFTSEEHTHHIVAQRKITEAYVAQYNVASSNLVTKSSVSSPTTMRQLTSHKPSCAAYCDASVAMYSGDSMNRRSGIGCQQMHACMHPCFIHLSIPVPPCLPLCMDACFSH